jgi:hypothetical protein
MVEIKRRMPCGITKNDDVTGNFEKVWPDAQK